MAVWYKRLWKRIKGETRKITITVLKEERDRIEEAAKRVGKSIPQYVKDHLPK